MSLQSLMYYQQDVRFGIWYSGCVDGQWLSQPHFVTWQTQRKGVAWVHTADNISPLFTRDFARLTCVERIIKCTGNCK